MIGRTNACGLSDQSWLNYIAVRNGTKTTIEAGDIDCSTITGTNSAAFMFYGVTTLTSATLDFRLLNGSNCFESCFKGCSSLSYLSLNLSSLVNGNSYIFTTTSITTFILTGIGNTSNWASTSIHINPLVALTLVTTFNVTVPILPNLYLAVMTSLNLASVVQVLGQLFDYSAGAAHTITFNRAFTGLSAADYALIDAAKTTAVARNWTVAGLTYSM